MVLRETTDGDTISIRGASCWPHWCENSHRDFNDKYGVVKGGMSESSVVFS